MVERPLGLISVDELVRVLPDLIADALRERDTRPPPSSQATLTKATGVVTTAGDITAEVQLDEDEPGVISQVQLSAAVSAGDRVVVLMSPGGSAIAIGNGNAQAAAQIPVSATLPIVNDDGTYTQTIEDSSGRLRLKNLQNAGSVALGNLILDTDGSVYLEARAVEAVVSALSGASVRIQSGSSAYVWAYQDASPLQEAFLAVQNLSAGLDEGTWSKPTFYTLSDDAQNIWRGMVSATASGDLDASEFGFWLDDTPGSASINWVAKDSAGTVVTGSLALA